MGIDYLDIFQGTRSNIVALSMPLSYPQVGTYAPGSPLAKETQAEGSHLCPVLTRVVDFSL